MRNTSYSPMTEKRESKERTMSARLANGNIAEGLISCAPQDDKTAIQSLISILEDGQRTKLREVAGIKSYLTKLTETFADAKKSIPKAVEDSQAGTPYTTPPRSGGEQQEETAAEAETGDSDGEESEKNAEDDNANIVQQEWTRVLEKLKNLIPQASFETHVQHTAVLTFKLQTMTHTAIKFSWNAERTAQLLNEKRLDAAVSAMTGEDGTTPLAADVGTHLYEAVAYLTAATDTEAPKIAHIVASSIDKLFAWTGPLDHHLVQIAHFSNMGTQLGKAKDQLLSMDGIITTCLRIASAKAAQVLIQNLPTDVQTSIPRESRTKTLASLTTLHQHIQVSNTQSPLQTAYAAYEPMVILLRDILGDIQSHGHRLRKAPMLKLIADWRQSHPNIKIMDFMTTVVYYAVSMDRDYVGARTSKPLATLSMPERDSMHVLQSIAQELQHHETQIMPRHSFKGRYRFKSPIPRRHSDPRKRKQSQMEQVSALMAGRDEPQPHKKQRTVPSFRDKTRLVPLEKAITLFIRHNDSARDITSPTELFQKFKEQWLTKHNFKVDAPFQSVESTISRSLKKRR